MNYYIVSNRTQWRGPWFATIEKARTWIAKTKQQWIEAGMTPPTFSVYYAGCPDAVEVI